MPLPDLPGVLSAAELRASGEAIAALQLPGGMIPWFPGGHCDPWNHVETAMALDVAGLHSEAALAYQWLADIQRPDGSWWNYYLPDGSVEEAKLDTNVCAYIATGVWHHWLCTTDGAMVQRIWPVVRDALDWVLSKRLSDGRVLWACTADDHPWDYALLTGSASISHALHCGARLGTVVGEPRRDWTAAADVLGGLIGDHPQLFEPKDRWAMDWYYPVLGGALTGEAAKARLAEGWESFAIDGKGIRCVSDADWITASETAECSIAYSAIGDRATAADLLAWVRTHRCDDGSYWTGIVYPSLVTFPDQETSAYTAAAVILAADAIAEASPASHVFAGRRPR
jgi:hypothetical protein